MLAMAPPVDRGPSAPAQAFRSAVEAGDHEAMMAALAPELRFHTPVYLNPIEDRGVVSILLELLLETFEDFHYTDELHGDGVHGLVFRTHVGDQQIEGLDLLRFDDSGLVDDFTVMIRPFSALEKLRDVVTAAMTERLG
jgi:hypothetical protein